MLACWPRELRVRTQKLGLYQQRSLYWYSDGTDLPGKSGHRQDIQPSLRLLSCLFKGGELLCSFHILVKTRNRSTYQVDIKQDVKDSQVLVGKLQRSTEASGPTNSVEARERQTLRDFLSQDVQLTYFHAGLQMMNEAPQINSAWRVLHEVDWYANLCQDRLQFVKVNSQPRPVPEIVR